MEELTNKKVYELLDEFKEYRKINSSFKVDGDVFNSEYNNHCYYVIHFLFSKYRYLENIKYANSVYEARGWEDMDCINHFFYPDIIKSNCIKSNWIDENIIDNFLQLEQITESFTDICWYDNQGNAYDECWDSFTILFTRKDENNFNISSKRDER